MKEGGGSTFGLQCISCCWIDRWVFGLCTDWVNGISAMVVEKKRERERGREIVIFNKKTKKIYLNRIERDLESLLWGVLKMD
jgi:hypothetical protein